MGSDWRALPCSQYADSQVMDKEARLRNCHDQGEWGLMTAECGSLDGTLEWKGHIRGRTGKI